MPITRLFGEVHDSHSLQLAVKANQSDLTVSLSKLLLLAFTEIVSL